MPADAVQLMKGATVVFRYQRGTVQAVPVVVGQQSANRAENRPGVRSGDQLLSGNTAKLRSPWPGHSERARTDGAHGISQCH